MVYASAVSKNLSKNDAGVHSRKEHGILVPKHKDFQSFFPALDTSKENPKTSFTCVDPSTGKKYDLNYTYYNKTKNEYRLTRARKFLQERGAQEGTRLAISKDEHGAFYIDLIDDTEAHFPSGTAGAEAPVPTDTAATNALVPTGTAATKPGRPRLGSRLVTSFNNGWMMHQYRP